jgi:hypothetical protein
MVSALNGLGVKDMVRSLKDDMGFRADLWVVGAQNGEAVVMKQTMYVRLHACHKHVSAAVGCAELVWVLLGCCSNCSATCVALQWYCCFRVDTVWCPITCTSLRHLEHCTACLSCLPYILQQLLR